MAYDHSWAESAAMSAELRYWIARRHAKNLDCYDPGLSDAIASWDGAYDTWGALLSMAAEHDKESIQRLVNWGLQCQRITSLIR